MEQHCSVLAAVREEPMAGTAFTQGGLLLVANKGDQAVAIIDPTTGKSIAEYLEQKLWKPARMEYDGEWISESDGGVSFGGVGFNATLRDYGHFAQFILDNGRLPDGTRALPTNWVRDATTWFAPSAIPGFAAYDGAGHVVGLATRAVDGGKAIDVTSYDVATKQSTTLASDVFTGGASLSPYGAAVVP